MFFDTYRLSTLRIAEDLRQAAAERSLRPTEPVSVLARPAIATSPMRAATTGADADCGECRTSVAA